MNYDNNKKITVRNCTGKGIIWFLFEEIFFLDSTYELFNNLKFSNLGLYGELPGGVLVWKHKNSILSKLVMF